MYFLFYNFYNIKYVFSSDMTYHFNTVKMDISIIRHYYKLYNGQIRADKKLIQTQ